MSEDPLLVELLDACEAPAKVRDEVKRLNQQGFVKLVQDLVHRPMENKYCALSVLLDYVIAILFVELLLNFILILTPLRNYVS